MYAVIKTGGKQYRVQPGDVLVVEKLDGDVGAEVSFDQVLMVGGDSGVTLGAPTVEGALVRATLIETRRGEKIKVFKKIRRQGYRRTRGHRQSESVLRVTGLEGAGLSAKWDGSVDLTSRAELVARARGLAPMTTTPAVQAQPAAAPVAETVAPEASTAAPKRARTAAVPETDGPATTDAMVEQPVSETPAAGAQTSVDADAPSETGSLASEERAAPAAKKPRAKKAASTDETLTRDTAVLGDDGAAE